MMINRSLLTKQPSNKTVKRKHNGQSVMHENELKARKVPLKAELILKLKDLEKEHEALKLEHEALKLENKNHIEINHDLEKKIADLEKNFQKTEEKKLEEDDNLDYSSGPVDCKRCEYQAEDGYDLDGHRWSEHEEDEDGHIICKFCDETFANVGNLMKHKKIKHREKVAICQNHNSIGCPFEDEKCWFLHITSNESFKCNICEEHFQTRSNFMKHRKSKHRSMVQLCKNKEKCVFISSCWFLHEILDEQKINHKSDEHDEQ